jgi:hypothetical protein
MNLGELNLMANGHASKVSLVQLCETLLDVFKAHRIVFLIRWTWAAVP